MTQTTLALQLDHTVPFIETLCRITGGGLDYRKITWQTLDDLKSRKAKDRISVTHGAVQDHRAKLESFQNRGAGLFLNINETTAKPGKRTVDDIRLARAVWVDIDDKIERSAGEELDLNSLPLPPSIIVRSGHGQHLYWVLDQPSPELARGEMIVKGIQHHLKAYGADQNPVLARPMTILRVPGSWNLKDPDAPQLVRLEFHDPRIVYDLDELEGCFPPPEVGKQVDLPKPNQRTDWATRLGGDEKIRRARGYMDTVPGGVSQTKGGQGRDFATLQAARKLIRGFDLTDEEAMPLLEDWNNQKNDPPVETSRLLEKIRNARKYGSKPFGHLLNVQRSRPNPRNLVPAGPMFPGQTVEVETPPAAVNDAELAQMGMDEMGLMHRFIARWGATTRWCPSWGSWVTWDGRRWTKDDSAAKARASRTINVLLDEAQTLPEGERRIAFVKWVGTILSNAARKRNAMLALAADELRVDASLMDVDPWLLNCANGVLDLRTGVLSPHDPNLLLSKLAPVEYPTQPVDCPGWKRFLNTVMDGNQVLVDFLQKAAGYTLTGETSDRSFFVLNGVGRNGKGVFKETIRDIMGDYAVNIAHRVITGENEHDTDALGLQGARFAEASEPGGKKWKAATLKRLTGQDTVDGRHMGANDRIEFRPVCKIWILANTDELPNTDSGDAFWDRLRLINFPVRFVREDEAGYDSTPPEHREVPDLKKKLQAEFPAILRWMVEGCIQWQRDGVLRVPQEIKTAVADYRAEQTPLRTFIEERCIIHPDAKVANQLLQVAFDQWAQRNGEPTMSGKMLTRTIQADAAWFQNIAGVTPSTSRTSTARWWHGIGLREPPELKGNQGGDDR